MLTAKMSIFNMEVRSCSPYERERKKISPGLQMQSEVKLAHMDSFIMSTMHDFITLVITQTADEHCSPIFN